MHPEITTDKNLGSLARKPARVHRRSLIVCLTIFMVAFGVRFLAWQDNYRDVSKVETFVTSEYKDAARTVG